MPIIADADTALVKRRVVRRRVLGEANSLNECLNEKTGNLNFQDEDAGGFL